MASATQQWHNVKEEHMRKAALAERRNQLECQVCSSPWPMPCAFPRESDRCGKLPAACPVVLG